MMLVTSTAVPYLMEVHFDVTAKVTKGVNDGVATGGGSFLFSFETVDQGSVSSTKKETDVWNASLIRADEMNATPDAVAWPRGKMVCSTNMLVNLKEDSPQERHWCLNC